MAAFVRATEQRLRNLEEYFDEDEEADEDYDDGEDNLGAQLTEMRKTVEHAEAVAAMFVRSYEGVVNRLRYRADQAEDEVRRFRIELEERAADAEGRSAEVDELTATMANTPSARSGRTNPLPHSCRRQSMLMYMLLLAQLQRARHGQSWFKQALHCAVALRCSQMATSPPATRTRDGEGQVIQASFLKAMEVGQSGDSPSKMEDASSSVVEAALDDTAPD